jgi:hypothetical protein
MYYLLASTGIDLLTEDDLLIYVEGPLYDESIDGGDGDDLPDPSDGTITSYLTANSLITNSLTLSSIINLECTFYGIISW